jgi:hypothetical protein
MIKRVLSYQDFISDSLKESLDPYHETRRKFKIGDQVKVKDRSGKITAFDGKEYLVLVGSKNERVKEYQIEKITTSKKKQKRPTRKKQPVEKLIKI